MYKIDMRGGAWGAVVQKSFTRTDPTTSGFRFQLPGSGSAKICGTPEPRDKISTGYTNFFTL